MMILMITTIIDQSVDGMTEPIDELAMTPESQQSAGQYKICHYMLIPIQVL